MVRLALKVPTEVWMMKMDKGGIISIIRLNFQRVNVWGYNMGKINTIRTHHYMALAMPLNQDRLQTIRSSQKASTNCNGWIKKRGLRVGDNLLGCIMWHSHIWVECHCLLLTTSYCISPETPVFVMVRNYGWTSVQFSRYSLLPTISIKADKSEINVLVLLYSHLLNSYWRIQEQQYCCMKFFFPKKYIAMNLYTFGIFFKKNS